MSLHTKYRPTTLDEVRGQNAVVKSLRAVLSSRKLSAHTFLFTGPSGVGKTTLARIVAAEIGIPSHNIVEVDAATNTGIDAMRIVKETVEAPSMMGDKRKLLIVDECHSLSKQAWQSMLKFLEEPPSHLYIALCTTEPGKVPKTIQTRCSAYSLSAVSQSTIKELLDDVVEAEGLKTSDDIITLVARESEGSPRQALVYLSMVAKCKKKKDAVEILRTADAEFSPEVVELCRLLIKGGDFMDAVQLVKAMGDVAPESIRIVVTAYTTKVLMGCKNGKQVESLLHVLDCFSDSYNPTDKQAPLLLSIGRALLGE